MCFSPAADFTAAAAVGVVGVATLRLVRTRRELIIGLLPLLFAAHQLIEGLVWLGLRGQVSAGLGNAARDLYALYAFAVLPMIVPVGFLLIEPIAARRRLLWPFVALGLAVGGYFLWLLATRTVGATVEPGGISYDPHAGGGLAVTAAYVVATCGPALLSSRRYLRWFGVVNLAAVVLAAGVHHAEFASIWCLYAALASLLILEHFRRERAAGAPVLRTSS